MLQRILSAFSGAIVLALVGAACGGGTPSPAPPAGPATIGIVRDDGVVVPFARHDQGSWDAPTLISDRPSAWFADIAASLTDWSVRAPLRWTDLLPDPIAARATSGPVEVAAHCQRVWGLRTNLPAGTVSPNDPLHAIGAAVSGGAELLPIAELPLNVAERAAMLEFLTPLFDAAEEQRAREREGRDGYEPRHLGAAVARRSLAVTRLHRVGRVGARDLYVFEAQRAYARPAGHPERECDELTIMQGWVAEAPDGTLALVRSDTAFGDCSFKGTPRLQPLATVRVAGRQFVVVVEHDYELETFVLFSLGDESVSPVLRVEAGGC